MVGERAELISTGIESFDKVLGGGLFRGSIVLLAGNPGVGKTTFAAHFLYYGAVKEGDAGLYVSFAEGKREFLYHMRSLGMDFEKLEKEGKFKFIEGLTNISDATVIGLIDVIGEMIDEIGARRVVLDPVTALMVYLKESEARVFFKEALVRFFNPLNITAYLIADLPFGRETIGFGFEEFLADVVLRLYYLGESGAELVRRRVIIQKSRYSPIPRYAYDFEITNSGIVMFVPLEDDFAGSYSEERVRTGIVELDEMLNGGLLRNSLTILSGPSGTGKTMISLSFVIEGALRGEKALYISFEEPSEQLKNMLRMMRYDVRKLEENIMFVYRQPRIKTAGQVMHELVSLIKGFKPSRLVIDGLSALEGVYDEKSLQDILRMLAHLCKSEGITTIFTSLKHILQGEEAVYNTLADTLIALNFEKRRNVLERVIAVLKMRGSPHDKTIRRLEFTKGKMVVRKRDGKRT